MLGSKLLPKLTLWAVFRDQVINSTHYFFFPSSRGE